MIDERIFYLKGAFDGDGHYRKDRPAISINVIDFEFLELIKTLIKEIFNLEVNICKQCPAKENSKEQRRINFHCGKEIYELLKNSVPITASDKIEYLKGMWDAEGSVGITLKIINKKNGKIYRGYDKWLTIAQKDISKLDLWCEYMKELGIKTNKIYRKDSRSYLSVRTNESIIQFSKLINFRITRKRTTLDLILDRLGQSQLSKEDIDKVIFIYTNTNFGIEYIGKMFNRTKVAILSTLKRYQVNTNKNKQRKIDTKDIRIVEEVLNKPIPFLLYQSKIKKEGGDEKCQ